MNVALVKIDEKLGYIDITNDKVIIPPKFKEAYGFSEGLARVMIRKKYGYMDKKGEIVIKPQFRGAGDFHEGLAWVKT